MTTPPPLNLINMQNEIDVYKQKYTELHNNNDIYDISGGTMMYHDKMYNVKKINGNIQMDISDKKSSTQEIALNDTNELLIHQNGMYMVGSIACATLLIFSIMIARQ